MRYLLRVEIYVAVYIALLFASIMLGDQPAKVYVNSAVAGLVGVAPVYAGV